MSKKIIKWGMEGFRSIGEYTEVELKPITLICGQNSSGKSSFINSILLMSQAVTKTPVAKEPSIPLNGPLVNLGPGMDNIVPVGRNWQMYDTNLFHEELTKIYCLIHDEENDEEFSAESDTHKGNDEDTQQFKDLTFRRFSIALGSEYQTIDDNGEPIYPHTTNFRSFEIGLTGITDLGDGKNFDASDFDIKFVNHFNPVDNPVLMDLFDLSDKEINEIKHNKEEFKKYIVGAVEKDSLFKETFTKEFKELKELGKPVPEVSTSVESYYDVIEASSKNLDFEDFQKEILSKIGKNYRFWPKEKDESLADDVSKFPGAIFNSGIPTGFLIHKEFGDDSLSTAKQLLMGIDHEYILDGVNSEILKDKDLEEKIDNYVIVPLKTDLGEDQYDSIQAYYYDSIPKRFHRLKGYELSIARDEIKPILLELIIKSNKENFPIPRDTYIEIYSAETIDEAQNIVSNYLPKERVKPAYIWEGMASEVDVYLDIPPENYGEKWKDGEKEEVYKLFIEGSTKWQMLDTDWGDINEFGGQDAPKNFVSYNKEENIIPAYDIVALSEYFKRSTLAISSVLQNNNDIPMDDVLLAMAFQNEDLPAHAVIKENLGDSVIPGLDFHKDLESLIFSSKGQNIVIPNESHSRYNTDGPIGLGKAFWSTVRVYNSSQWKSTNDPETVFNGLLTFLEKAVDLNRLSRNPNNKEYLEQLVAGYYYGALSEPENFLDDIDIPNELSKVDIVKISKNKTYSVQDIVDATGAKEKSIRARLRKTIPRDEEHKGTSWKLTREQFEQQVEHWSDSEAIDETMKGSNLNPGIDKEFQQEGLRSVLVASGDISTTAYQKLRNSDFIEDTLSVLKNIKYLGPLRSSNQKTRDSVLVEQIPLGRDAEYFYQYFHNWKDININCVLPEYQNNEWIVDSSDIREEIKLSDAANKWFEYFGIAKSFNTGPDSSGNLMYGFVEPVDLTIPIEGPYISTKNIGVGFSQIAPIIVLCLTANPGDLIILEEPESNLHPDAQRMLGEFFVAMESSNKRFIIETHSDHLINRLRLKVAEAVSSSDKSISSDKVGIYFAEKDNGETQYKLAKLDEDGSYDMSDYPKGFFNQATKDALKLIALRNKK